MDLFEHAQKKNNGILSNELCYRLCRLNFVFNTKWVSAAKLSEFGLDRRTCRQLAEESDGHIISGNSGYCLIENATPEEIAHASDRMISQAKKMLKRGIAIRRRGHELVNRGAA